MDLLKTEFTISDLENLSGIKKHTIRIWEKRYGLLTPKRTETNIRYYSVDSLVHLLNIALLNKNGHKISKIANLGKAGIIAHCKELIASDDSIINQMKLAMIQFDEALFESSYKKLSKDLSFSAIYLKYFVRLLTEIGLLWQTNTITPAHEHFISNLIARKIIKAIESAKSTKKNEAQYSFVLFLPEQEMHDIGLLYINYELVKQKQNVIYLGQSISLKHLSAFREAFTTKVVYVTYFTVLPKDKVLKRYLRDFKKEVLSNESSELWLLGNWGADKNLEKLPEAIYKFSTLEEIDIAIRQKGLAS